MNRIVEWTREVGILSLLSQRPRTNIGAAQGGSDEIGLIGFSVVLIRSKIAGKRASVQSYPKFHSADDNGLDMITLSERFIFGRLLSLICT